MIAALATFGGPGPWGHGGWGGGPGPWFLLGPLMWIAVIAIVLFVTRRAGLWGPRKGKQGEQGQQSRWSSWGGWADQGGGSGESAPAGGGGRMSAEDILAERFARGEIDEAEYQERLTTLRASS